MNIPFANDFKGKEKKQREAKTELAELFKTVDFINIKTDMVNKDYTKMHFLNHKPYFEL